MKLDIEIVKDKFFKNGLIPMFDEYQKNCIPLLCQDIETKYIGYITYNALQSGQWIKWFGVHNDYTIYNIKQYIINAKLNCEIVSSVWISAYSNMTFRCNKCKEEYEMSWNAFTKRSIGECPTCYKKMTKNHNKKDFSDIVNVFDRYGYTILESEYKSNKQKLKVIDCNGYKGLLSYKQLNVGGNGFDKFHPKNPYTIENIKHYIEINNINAKIMCDVYVNNASKIMFMCECKDIYQTTLDEFINQKRHRCKRCTASISKCEKIIMDYLTKIGINYSSQKRFKECKYKKSLIFDFYGIHNNISYVIEVNGIQHYYPVKHFGGDDVFSVQIEKDKIKKKYCKDNNIKFIELSYLDIKDNRHIQIINDAIYKT